MTRGQLRLVVVDNDQAVLDLLLLDLGLEGHAVVAVATNGEDGVRACEEQTPDVLVVDYRLGQGMNGVDVARHVRRPDLRVVLFTNYMEPDVIAAAKDAGAMVVEKGNLRALRRAVEGS
jgi:CheY-like chemotaxis protein